MSVASDRLTPSIHRLFKMAIWAGAETAVKLHIARGDDPNARDDAGLTPLMIAAARNKAAICRLLIAAGADLAALDPCGRSALAIASLTGATQAVAIIELALAGQAQPARGTDLPLVLSTCAFAEEATSFAAERSHFDDAGVSASHSTSEVENEGAVNPSSASSGLPETLEALLLPVQAQPARIDFEHDGEPFDLSGWEAEEQIVPPVDDRPAAIAHVATQEAIAQHVALDDSADWADFEADLPAHAAPLLRAQDSEGRSEIRALLLRASREGSVPEQVVEDVCRDANGARHPDTESLLGLVLNDMGAETDDRFEFRSPFENFETYVDPNESDMEADTIDEALGFLDNLRSKHNEPILLYMREAQRTVLLSAEKEAGLGKSMDRAADLAMDALSCWRAGIEWVVNAIGSARRGDRSVSSIASIARDATGPLDANTLDDGFIEESKSFNAPINPPIDEIDEDNGTTQIAPEAEALDVFALADELASLTTNVIPGREDEIRATLAALAPRRSFLIELSGAAADGTAESNRYGQAICALMLSRDRMVRANLRLVISLAKKHMYSGVPMDDLIQDGNIGLMNAVDKFDWRRGFRFSTMATWWIRQQITRSIADSSLAIRLPVHVFEIAQRFPREIEALEKSLGHPPTIGQLAERVGHETRKIETLLRACSTPLSIDALDDESNLEVDGVDPFEKVSAAHLRRTLDALLGELGAKPEKILRLRYGICIDEPQTLEEIGVLFDVTRERIRQIESKAMRKLKHPTRLSRLSCWSLHPDELASAASEAPDNDNEGGTVSSPSPALRADPMPPASRKAPSAESGMRLSPLEKVLREATLLEIPVEQSARGNDTTTWVHLTKAADNRHRKLIRSLMEMGFEYWPGKGYRR